MGVGFGGGMVEVKQKLVKKISFNKWPEMAKKLVKSLF